nr:unnamed protein product [Callosobruchus chinensis]
MTNQPCPGVCALGPVSRVIERPENKFLDTPANTEELAAFVNGQQEVIPVIGGVFIDYELGPVFNMASSTKKQVCIFSNLILCCLKVILQSPKDLSN